MPFDPIGGFVETKALRVHTGVAGIFYGLGVDDDQRRPWEKRAARIELASLAWKAKVLPLNYARMGNTREAFITLAYLQLKEA